MSIFKVKVGPLGYRKKGKKAIITEIFRKGIFATHFCRFPNQDKTNSFLHT